MQYIYFRVFEIVREILNMILMQMSKQLYSNCFKEGNETKKNITERI